MTAASSASGVITAETTGMASAFASGPATDTWPKSSKTAGASPAVIAHCTRIHCSGAGSAALHPVAT
jgi:hypothetical protein